jgi:PEGA domain
VGAENLNPLDELKNLDQSVEHVNDLEGLKPIYFRLDEIAKQNADDFEVQLVVGDIKQHLVNRGNRIKTQPPAAPPIVPPVAPPEPPRPSGPPPMQVVPPGVPPGVPPIVNPPRSAPPPVAPAPRVTTQSPTAPMRVPVIPNPKIAPPPTQVVPSSQPPGQGPLSTGQQPPVYDPQRGAPSMQGPPMGQYPPQGPPPMQGPPMGQYPPQGPPPQGPPPPKPATNWRRPLLLGALMGALVSIVVIVFLVNQARKRNAAEKEKEVAAAAAVQVDVTTTPPNASIRVNGDQKCTSPCQVALAPGTYQIVAFLDGYDAATSELNVASGQPANLNLALTAQPQSVRILTDLEAGTVLVDDQPSAELQEGQFVIDNVMPGPHTVKVTGKTGEAMFSFEVAEAKPPVITGSVTARNLVAVLVSSLGKQAHVVTNSGPLKMTVNGQPEGDASPSGVDLKTFQPGVDEIVLGDGQDQRNFKESFGPAPMLTAFLKSDLNIGTLIVSTGEDGVKVFVNDKEYRRKTAKGQVRVQTIGNVSVRVVKDGFQQEPAQTTEVKKGAEIRLEFKMKALPQVAGLQIRGGTPGAEVFVDGASVGTVSSDGSFSYQTISPGDHSVELRRDGYGTKSFKRSFRAGAPVTVSGADVVLASAAPGNGTIRIARTPAEVAVTYRRSDESAVHELRGDSVDLPPGSYVVFGKAPGYSDRIERVTLAAGETHPVTMTLTKTAVVAPATKAGDITSFFEPDEWKKDGEQYVRKGGGFVPYKLGPKGVYTFTVGLVKGGGVFRGGRIRWFADYADPKNYLEYELDQHTFWAEVIEKGKKLERAKMQHGMENQKQFTLQVEITPEHIVHRIKNAEGTWVVLDSFAEPGRNFAGGPFGFLIQGSDEIGISNFSFQPR